jgi:AcrR family transcriptional regulator
MHIGGLVNSQHSHIFTSINNIVERLGSGASTIHHYFPSKQAILEQAVDEVAEIVAYYEQRQCLAQAHAAGATREAVLPRRPPGHPSQTSGASGRRSEPSRSAGVAPEYTDSRLMPDSLAGTDFRSPLAARSDSARACAEVGTACRPSSRDRPEDRLKNCQLSGAPDAR